MIVHCLLFCCPPCHCSLLLFCCSLFCFPLFPLFTVSVLLSTFPLFTVIVLVSTFPLSFFVHFSTVHCYCFVALPFSHVASNGRTSGSEKLSRKRNSLRKEVRLLSSSFMGQTRPCFFSLRDYRGSGNLNCWRTMSAAIFLVLLSKGTQVKTCCGFWWGLTMPRCRSPNTSSSTLRSP